LYVGLQTTSTTLTYGKNWSSYYRVSGITDRFESFGGEASGTFNALTDGGETGTGRANNVFQGRFSIKGMPEKWKLKPFKLNVQIQNGEDIPQVDGANYKQAFGISAILESTGKKMIGIAYNQALIDDKDLPNLRTQGMDGDSRALIIGTRRFGDKYYAGMTISRLENQETTNTGIYFDGWGWEFFGSYNFSNRWWVVGGWNALEPDSRQPLAGDYRLRYGVLGLRYTFDKFREMVYSEIRLDNSLSADGTRPGNTYTVGVRWDVP
jgi:predicted porin